MNFITRHRIDVVFISETHLRDTSFFRIRNMHVYRTDRQGRRGGGSAILVRKEFIHHEEQLPPLQHIEAAAVTIATAIGNITCVAVYLSPKDPLLAADLHHIFDRFDKVLMGGDLNSKHAAWNARRPNPRGQTLFALEDELNITVLGPREPTRIPRDQRQHPDVLDIALVKNINVNLQLRTINDLSSDHKPVIGILDRASLQLPQYMTHQVDWETYERYLTNNVRPTMPIDTRADIDTAVDTLTAKISTAKRRATTARIQPDINFEPFPPALQQLKTERNRVRRRWLQFRDPADRQQMNQLNRELSKCVVEWRQESWERKMNEFLLRTREEWSVVKNLRQQKPPKRAIQGPNGLLYDPLAQAELYADTYETQMTLPPPPPELEEHMADFEEQVLEEVETRRHSPTHIPPELTTPREVKVIIQKTTNNSPGKDRISNEDLKHLPRKPLVLLTRIYNACLQHSYFPSAWKIARVAPIPKPGKDLSQPTSYRPISLLPTLGKILERIILKRINDDMM